ncbi:CMP/dCMP-type deaminase domain-containing protein [Aphelenchoides fujianensis]|nr:CMP/dCMP-type deaminase domain-containing protein [Aphelenchoides fujianensis]
MQQAVAEAGRGVECNDGGPFGAVVVRDGRVISSEHNMNDPTAHAEITAIRSACAKEGTFDLTGCILYTSCYPCPMCMGAALWAGIKEVHYAATSEDADGAGFGDAIYHDFLKAPEKGGLCELRVLDVENKLAPFKQWNAKLDKIPY